VSLLHVLFAIALSLGCVWARCEEAAIQIWCVGVLVVDMAITFLFGRPPMFVVLAGLLCTLPRTLMSLEVLGEVARTLELLIAQRAFMYLRFGVLLPPGH
jgi:hypothetical protein